MKIFFLTLFASLSFCTPVQAMYGDGSSGGRPPCGWTTFGMYAGGSVCTWDPSNGFYWSP